MIERINENNLLNTQNGLQETQASQAVSPLALKNAYGANKSNLIDETDISQEAVSLYQRELEVNRYKKYLDTISEEEATQQVVDLMEKGVIDISEEELAQSMFNDISLLNELFSQQ